MSESKWMVQLQAVLDCPVRQLQLPFHTWEAHKDEIIRLSAETSKQTNAVSTGDYVAVSDGPIWFALHGNQNGVDVLEVDRGLLTEKEMRIIAWTLSQMRSAGVESYDGYSESERYARELGDWITEQLDSNELQLSLPDQFKTRGKLFSSMIPFLLVCEQAESARSSYHRARETASYFSC